MKRDHIFKSQLQGADRNITNPRVLKAMNETPRHEFVPLDERSSSYSDSALPIGYGQTISQPYVVAFMTEQLDPQPADRILEVGTGSGYQAAILSPLVDQVYTLEIVEPLGERARETLQRLGYHNVHVRLGDGYQGWPEEAPFDAIIVTCSPEDIPPPLVEQLKEGGRLVIPVGVSPHQTLYLLRKQNGEIHRDSVLSVAFVPMTGKARERA